MKLKNFLILLFVFMMVFSYFATVSPYPAVQSSTNKYSKVQQNSCPILVSNGAIIVPIDLINISGVWKYQDYDPTYSWDQQTAQNYYTGYYDNNTGKVYNLNLANNTQVVVAGFNYKNNTYQVMSDFCFNVGPPPNYGVQDGDSFTYNFTTNTQGPIPLFDLFNGTMVISNGETFTVGVSKITTDNVTLKFVWGNTTNETIETMFFIVPLNLIESLINGTYVPGPNNGPNLNLVGYTNTTIKIDLSDSHGNTTVVLDRMHGNLVSLDGIFLDPQNNTIKMSIQLIYSPYGIPNANPPPQDQSSSNKYHIFGVNKGDSLTYNFTTDSPNKMPFFGLNGDNPVIQNGDSIKVDIVDILVGLNQPPLLLQYTIGSNTPFKTNESVFFIVPIDMLNAIVNGSYTPDSTSNEPKIQKVSDNSSVTVVSAVSKDFSATLQFDKQHGTLLALTGKITDPQNNVFNIGITLASATFSTDSTNQQTSSNDGNTLTTSPGFELLAFLPLVPILVAIKKKKHN